MGRSCFCLSAIEGIILNKFSGCFSSMQKAAASALVATIIILPGFLFVKDIQTGWELLKAMVLPYGLAISCGIFLVGLLLNKEEERYYFELSFKESEEKYRVLIEGTEDLITQTDKNIDTQAYRYTFHQEHFYYCTCHPSPDPDRGFQIIIRPSG